MGTGKNNHEKYKRKEETRYNYKLRVHITKTHRHRTITTSRAKPVQTHNLNTVCVTPPAASIASKDLPDCRLPIKPFSPQVLAPQEG